MATKGPRPEDTPLRGASVLVMGLGRFSGGVETIRFLAAEGAKVVVSDSADAASLAESVEAIRPTGVEVVFGPQTPALLDDARRPALVVASPAIPFDHPVLVEAERRGIPTTTEISLFVSRVSRVGATVFGVTGTKGKSTTSTLLANMLSASGRRTHLGGNVGQSLLNALPRIQRADAVVLELSSFQLHWLRRLEFAPRVAVVTNLFPDHLDRHGTFEAYAAAKRAILEFQGPDDIAVLPATGVVFGQQGFRTSGRAARVHFSGEWFDGDAVIVTGEGGLADAEGGGGTDLAGFRLWGRHNRVNAAAAAAAARAAGVTWAEVRAGAAATAPLRHRLEPVGEHGGILFVDDSIATTPQSAAAALEAVPRPCVILVGGKDKCCDPAPLFAAIRRHARGVVGIGTTGPSLVAALAKGGGPPALGGGANLASAVRAALSLARPGDAVLLSPGYSSLDQHPSFAVRGDRFRAAAEAASGIAVKGPAGDRA